MNLDIRIQAVGEPKLFPEFDGITHEGELVGVGVLEKGMESGRCSAFILIQDQDGKVHLAQVSARMLVAIGNIASGAMDRFGDPKE